MRSPPLRWQLTVEEDAGRLFPDEEIVERHIGAGEYRGLEFFHVNAHRLLNEVPNSPYGFSWTVNAYRGCSHACTYCFARPTHEYLGLDMASDFDSKIVVKINAVERLRAEVRHPRWRGDLVAMGTNTDPYQSAEGRYRLTRGLISVFSEASNPFSILTKSPLILRDIELLAEAASRTEVRTSLSVGTLDVDTWKLTEPGAPHPARRLEAVAQLNEAGVPCAVLMGPVVPGLSDSPDKLAAVVDRAVAAGATSISAVYLHLRGPLRQHVLGWADRERPALGQQWRQLYRNSPYVPAAMRTKLSQHINELTAEAHRRHSSRGRCRPGPAMPGPSVEPAAAQATPTSHQLELPLQ